MKSTAASPSTSQDVLSIVESRSTATQGPDVSFPTSFEAQLHQAKNKTAEAPPPKERFQLFMKGIPMMFALVIGATAYWMFYLWDFKNLERRTRHYKLKLFNTWMTYFRPVSVNQWEEWRQHECEHCGACCEILWRCPFLKTNEDGNSHCSVHSKRPLPCRTFPIDPRSVELISKHRKAEAACSYRFAVLFDQMIEDDKKEKAQASLPTNTTSSQESAPPAS
ncbi:MAG: YkgJ family cysteine cluster protein [Deltaproteobacteria bacterium]|nr:MAG: YkgJ family cysteine cluster protein [Deltaproteobacteria bacterium]